jgi:hypothetical protein
MREKNPCLLAPLPSADAIFLRPGQSVTMNLPRRGESLNRLIAFKRTFRPSSGLIYGLDTGTLDIATFLVTISRQVFCRAFY